MKQSSFMEKDEPEEEKKDVPMESAQEAEKGDEIDQTFIGKVKQLIEFQDKSGHNQ